MHLVAINGSPKSKGSATGTIIETIAEMMGTEVAVFQATTVMRSTEADLKTAIHKILNADAVVIAFPLYFDAFPTPLISLLQRLETEAKTSNALPKVYGVCQCGFYEGAHTEIALKILENFCSRSGMAWQFGLGIGGGELLTRAKNMNTGMTKHVYQAIGSLYEAIKCGAHDQRENVFLTPPMPRWIYQLAGSVSWKRQAKGNGAAGKLDATPFLRGD